MSTFQWLGTFAVAALVLSPSPGTSAHQESASTGWTGTVTVEQTTTASVEGPAGPDKLVETTRVTYSLHGDGTASWTATHSSNADFALGYTIPARGSGRGMAYVELRSGEGEWDLKISGVSGSIGVVTDMSDHDRWMVSKENTLGHAVLGQFLEELGYKAKAVARHETEDLAVPDAIAGWKAPDTATSHSGSFSENLPGTLPPFYRVTTNRTTTTWRLAKGRPVRPGVTIYGPACGCVGESGSTPPLRFIAGTSQGGGEFSEFSVTSDGVEPEILSNEGGEQPMLEISGTKETGAVTLRITYERDGVRVQSAPLKVEFCEIETIQLANGNEHDLSFDSNEQLVVRASTRAWRGGRDVSADLQWDLEAMGSPTTLSSNPSTKQGGAIVFTYDGLPLKNADFGEKRLVAKVGGGCDCERQETIRTFFPVAPDYERTFEYWKQTDAVPAALRGIVKYVPYLPPVNDKDDIVAARYDPASGTVFLSDFAMQSRCLDEVIGPPDNPAQTGRQARGIDCFAELVRHELQHRTDAIEWWGSEHGTFSKNQFFALWLDSDLDQVPNSVEEQRRGCEILSRRSCAERPFAKATDMEINAYRAGWSWPIGSIDKEDWSCGPDAKQWRKGRPCG